MNKIQMMVALFSTGIIGHLIMRKSMDIGNAIRAMIFNQRGEGEAGTITFTEAQQAHIDKIINTRVGEIKSKYEPIVKEAEELKKFKGEYEKSLETKNQEDLVKAKKYEEAEGNYKKQINEFSTKLSAKDQEIQDLKITHSLGNELSKQGAFLEESIALMKGAVVLDANGNAMYKTKDANGVDTQLPLADGIKKFLTERPHLVKSTFKGGAGSGGSGSGAGGEGGAGGGEETLDTLNAKYAEALKGTDLKLRSELKGKINAKLNEMKVSR